MAFDLLFRGGLLIDGSGASARHADIGVTGDRVTAIGDLSAINDADVATVIDATGHVVSPGFVDPHGHSDGSVLLDGALASHLRQGFTTQLSGNCGYTYAPMAGAVRAMLDADFTTLGLDPAWTTFADYLDEVERQPLGPNVAFLVGHGTVRWAAMGPDGHAPSPAELESMVRYVDEALESGAVGLSSGLIYAPGVHAAPDEVAALVAATARRDGLYATHMRNESAGVLDSLDEAISTTRMAGELAGRPARLQVSHLKAGARSVWGTADTLIERLEAARRDGIDAAADQYPYTAAATTLSIILPPAILALSIADAEVAIREPGTRAAIRDRMREGISGWENVTLDPGWAAIVISRSASRPDWAGRSIQELADELGEIPSTSRSTSSRTTASRSTS